MTDIPKMLRAEALIADEDWTGIYQISPDLAFAAADRIEKLEAALREIIQEDALTGKTVFVGDFGKIAIAALREKE